MDLPRIEAAVREILLAIGEDPDREGLVDTPGRVARMYAEVFAGLSVDPHTVPVVTFPEDHREMVILRTAWLVRSPFEWGEHVAYGKKLGLTSEEIERIAQGSAAPGWNEHDRAVLRGVEELVGDHAVSDATWAVLAKSWGEPQLMELPGLVGSYTMSAMLYNTLRFGLLKGNEGFKQR